MNIYKIPYKRLLLIKKMYQVSPNNLVWTADEGYLSIDISLIILS